MLCFVVVMQSFIMNSHEVFIHIHQGCFAGTGAIVRLPQCHWSKPDGYGKISQCITTTKHSKAKTVCIFLGIYCIFLCTMGLGANIKGLIIALVSSYFPCSARYTSITKQSSNLETQQAYNETLAIGYLVALSHSWQAMVNESLTKMCNREICILCHFPSNNWAL